MAIPVIQEHEVLAGKSMETKTFGFHQSYKLAKTLAETLYNYKMEAVAREYTTNIVDSHEDAGIPEKKGFVHVPTQLEPFIRFQDFGVGMTKETIFNVYTVFGLSTKEHDNTTNGSLGYGSKSAYTIADQFTVTSVKDGIKSVVVCYKNKIGEPTADLKFQKQVNEGNGTVVEIPVNINQVSIWQKTFAKVLGAFRNPPEVNTFGEHQKIFDEVSDMCKSVRENGSYFSINKKSNLVDTMRSCAFALMGDVLYELPDFHSLVGKTALSSHIKESMRRNLYVGYFDIGQLDHAPSREAISYDTQTLRRVKLKVNKDIHKQIRKLFGNFNGTLNYYKFYHKFRDTTLWSFFYNENVKIPFADNLPLYKLVDSAYSSPAKVSILKGVVGKIRGLVPSASGYYEVFNSAVESLPQYRVVKIINPVIVYSENPKGVYKIQETLEKIKEEFDTPILCVDTKDQAETLQEWFGCGKVLLGDPYSPEKVKPKRKKVATSFGVKEDYETVGSVLELTEKGYTSSFTKIDLSEEGVYYTIETFEISGVVPDHTTKISAYNNDRLRNVLQLVGGKKVVILNRNNKGKIQRAGTPNLKDALLEKVKQHKKDLITYLCWSSLDRHQSLYCWKDEILMEKDKDYKKYLRTMENNLKLKENYEIQKLVELSTFHLTETKSWKQKYDQGVNLINKVKVKCEKLKDKLPLYDSLDSKKEFEYYLKLEKVIK